MIIITQTWYFIIKQSIFSKPLLFFKNYFIYCFSCIEIAAFLTFPLASKPITIDFLFI